MNIKLNSYRQESSNEGQDIIISPAHDMAHQSLKMLNSYPDSQPKVCEVETVNNDSDLIRIFEIKPTNTAFMFRRGTKHNSTNIDKAIDDYRKEQMFFQIIEKGDLQELRTLEDIIDSDPKKYVKRSNNLNSIVNCKNRDGYTPLYLACRNGSLEYAKFFIHKGADFNIKCGEEQESCLEVASRWEYVPIVKLLMKYSWPLEDIQRAKNLTRSKNIYKLLEKNNRKKKCCWYL